MHFNSEQLRIFFGRFLLYSYVILQVFVAFLYGPFLRNTMKHRLEDVLEKERESFGSRLGFILVSAGCAVGLGNVWKFPYICGQNGGALFVLIYLIFLVILGMPILIFEFSVGRGSHRGPARAYDLLEKPGSKWHLFKWFSIVGNYLLMMFYTMVGGWMLYYVYLTASGALTASHSTATEQMIEDTFHTMLGSPASMAVFMLLAVMISLGVCALGLQNGIERISKVMMSLLIVLIIVLAFHSLLLPNSRKGVSFYLIPNLDAIRRRGIGPVIFDAMTHAFFTLSVGMGSMEIFGSYLNKDNTITSEARNVVILDTFVALMAGFIIIPACFAYGIQPDAGPSLLFITLPNVFSHMSGGRIWGVFFFIFMSFAALSTIIAVFENILSFYMDQMNWSRRKAVLLNIVLIPLLSMPAVLGYNVLSGFQPMGSGSTIMDLEDFLVSYNILPLGSMVFVLFCTHKNGWGWNNFLAEANTGKGSRLRNGLRFYMTYILPAIIVVVYLKGYYDTFAPRGRAVLTGWMLFALLLVSTILYITSRGSSGHKISLPDTTH